MKRSHGSNGNAARERLDFKAIAQAVDLAALITQHQGQPKGSGRSRKWLCPFHDDRNTPGLTLTPDGRRFKCWTCGASGDAIDFLAKVENISKAEVARRLSGGQVGGPIGSPRGKPVGRSVAPQGKAPPTYPTLEKALEEAERRTGGKVVASWSYLNPDRSEAFRIVRTEATAEEGQGKNKKYRPVHQNAQGRWAVADPPGPLPLYRLPELLDHSNATVWIFEGEKVAEAAAVLGFVATTSAHGAQAADKTDWSPLAGRDLVIVPDNDPAGEDYTRAVLVELATLDPRPSVKVLRLEGLPEHGDLVEWLVDRPDSWGPDECRGELEMLANGTPAWRFDHSPGSNGSSWGPGHSTNGSGKPLTDEELGLIHLSTVKSVELEWLWPNRIPLGKLSILAGEGGLGKSFMSLDLATIISRGATWPDDPVKNVRQGDVIILSAEDDLDDTIVPRLKAMGADLNRICSLGMGKDSKGKPTPITLADIDRFEQVIARCPETRLIIVDPIPAFLGRGVDDNKNAELRELLSPLTAFAARHRIAILGITHFSKAPNARAVNRVIGSVAYANAARAVWCVVLDPENENRRLFLPAKHNLTEDKTGMAYTITDGRVVWESDPITKRLNDVLAADGERSRKEKDRDRKAIAWLQEFLRERGPTDGEEVLKHAKASGFSRNRIWSVKEEAKVRSRKQGFDGGRWAWVYEEDIPDHPAETPPREPF
jgi:putative DNA primase/helicase